MTKDRTGNPISNNELTYSPMPPFWYLSEAEEAAIDSAGEGTKFGTLLMMVLAVIVIAIQ